MVIIYCIIKINILYNTYQYKCWYICISIYNIIVRISMDYDDEEQYNEALEEEEDSLLSELLKLHKKLDRVRFTNNSNNEPNNSNKIFDGFNAIVCGNSTPVSVFLNEEGTGYVYRKSIDALRPALDTLLKLGANIQCLSWPGCAGVTSYAKNGIEKKLIDEYKCKPIFLKVSTAQGYMEFCDEVLFPIFFSMLDTESTSNPATERLSSFASTTITSRINSINNKNFSPLSLPNSSQYSPLFVPRSPSSLTFTTPTSPSSFIQQRSPLGFQLSRDQDQHQRLRSDSSFTIGMPNHHRLNSTTNVGAHASSISYGNSVSIFLATLKLRMTMFEEVQKIYLSRLTEIYDNADKYIIVNDIGLMLLPRLIRKRFENANVIFIMRSPFPSFDVFSVFAQRQELLEGCLGADIIMFDHFHFIQNFISVCERLLGLEASPSVVEFEGRLIKLIVAPPGIIPENYTVNLDPPLSTLVKPFHNDAINNTIGHNERDNNNNNNNADDYLDTSDSIETNSIVSSSDSMEEKEIALAESKNAGKMRLKHKSMTKQFFGKKVIVAYDKLSRVSGIMQKISAFAMYLKENPSAWKKKQIVLVQVVYGWMVPGITGKHRYATDTLKFLSKQISKLVSSVNGMYGAVDYVPIRLIRNVDFHDLLVLYHIADVGIITTLKGGIDVTGLEFVAAQDESNPGVLLYSEFLSCATSLKGAITINPYDVDAVAEAIKRALVMTVENRQLRLLKLLKYVRTYNAQNWASQLVKESNKMNLVKLENKSLRLPKYHDLQATYTSSIKRLFVFSYQGVLSPDFSAFPQVAPPTSKTLSILRQLCNNANNVVYVMGGINKVNMETWFSGIPRLGLIMEYGYAFKMHNESNNNDNCYSNSPFSTGRIKSTWHPTAGNWDTNLSWKTEVMEVLHHYAERTPGAYIDVSLESCIVWHYHHADIDIGQAQAKELYTLLDSMLTLKPIETIFSSIARAIVIRPIGCNGATALARILDRIMDLNRTEQVNISNNTKSNLSPINQSTSSLFDFTFCVASHRYDIGLFNSILSRYRDGNLRNAFTCISPKGVSKAQYYVDKREIIVDILDGFCASTR